MNQLKCSPSGSTSITARGRMVRHERILTARRSSRARGERPVEDVRLAHAEAVVEPHAGFDQPGGLLGGDLGCLPDLR